MDRPNRSARATAELSRRRFSTLAAAALCGVNVPGAGVAFADAWPDRPVRLVVTFPPGGANDIIARLMCDELSRRLGQQFIVDNRVGGGGNIGAETVARAAPDGYTLLQCSVSNATNASLYKDVTFNFEREMTAISGVYKVPLVIDVLPSFPAKDVTEFIAYAKANPGKISFASGGVGTMAHIAGELMKQMAGVDMVHVPYRGSPEELSDLIAGRIEVVFDPLPTSLDFIKDGRLRALAVTTAKRTESLPGTPTVGEFLPGYEASVWVGIAAPKATPAAILEKLNAEINAVLATPAFAAKLRALGAEVFPTPRAEFANFIAADTRKWAGVINAAGIKAQ